MAYLNINSDPEFLKTKTKDDQLRELQYKTQKHDHEKNLKSLKSHNDYYKKKYESPIKKKVLLNISEVLIGSASTKTSSTLSTLNASIEVVI